MSNLRDGVGRDDGMGERSGDVTGQGGDQELSASESAVPDPARLDPTVPDPAVPDPAVLVGDDLLLDALGRGGAASADDPIAGWMAAWRAELDADQPSPDDDLTAVRVSTAAGSAPAQVRPPRPEVPVSPPGPGAPAASPHPEAPVGPRGLGVSAGSPRPGVLVGPRGFVRPRFGPSRATPRPGVRPGRRTRRLLLSAVAVVVSTALLGLGVNQADPASPLWPVAAAVYPDRSAVRAVEHTITLARDAAQAGRYDDARHQLDQAVVQVAEVRQPEMAGRLRADIERIRLELPAAGRPDETAPDERTTSGSAPAVPVSPGPGDPAPAGTPGGAGSPGARSPAAAEPSPVDPSPPRVLPLPIPVLPSLLPSGLPLPSGGCLLICPVD